MKITLSTGHALLSIHMHFDAHSTPPEQGRHVKEIVLWPLAV